MITELGQCCYGKKYWVDIHVTYHHRKLSLVVVVAVAEVVIGVSNSMSTAEIQRSMEQKV